jgi:hypothetical protein
MHSMHCDDKRMLYVFEEQIKSCWENLRSSDYQSESLLKELNEVILEYNEYKKMLKIQ